MSNGWLVRDCTRDDIPQIYELAQATYGQDPNSVPVTFSYEHVVWQLLQNPAGPFRACVAYTEERLVGFYGVIPVELYCQGREVAGSLSLLTMTHPAYQHQGIFRTLASRLYEQLGKEGIAVTYGFPNENSLPGLTSRLQWTHIATLDMFVRPLNPAAIVRKFTEFPLASSVAGALLAPLVSHVSANEGLHYDLREVKRFDDRVDMLMEARKGRYAIQRVRDSAYLNWRYATCPDWDYCIVLAEDREDLLGYMVLRYVSQFGLSGGMIMDISALPGRLDVLHALLNQAVACSHESGVDLVACLIHGDADVMRALRRCWFVKVPRRLGFKNWYFGARLNNEQLSAELVSDPGNWFLTLGDDDPL